MLSQPLVVFFSLFRTHLAPSHTAFPFPKDLYMKFVLENNGYFPVKVQALQDGTCVHAHVPVYQVTGGCLCRV
jgi:nicotinamide phosphoribosyltransferase